MRTEPVVQARKVSKTFAGVRVLREVSLELGRGEMVALIGASGSGKSTLIRSIAGLTPIDRVTNGSGQAGEILLFSQPMQQRGRIAGAANALRARTGVIFQQFNLVPRLSVLTNVCLGRLGRMPFLRASLGQFSTEAKRCAMRAMTRVGIAEHALKRGCDLSGGQQQRAAIARALMQGAEFIVADEPIASLDPHSARNVMDILSDLNRRDGITVLVSLHQVEYALRYCPRTVALKAGEVVYDGPSSALTREFLGSIYGSETDDLFAAIDSKPITAVAAAEAPTAAINGAISFDPSHRMPTEHRTSAHA
ncbi:MAG: phosphonate ABC transporter ATP-binding protein [Alphaproteobacteria bacterium]|nr:phosphonate ABC transporter ATP-binding protein [Alphaproteobacteria bacterium]